MRDAPCRSAARRRSRRRRSSGRRRLHRNRGAVDQAKLAGDKTLAAIGKRHDATAAQIALAWGLRHPDSIVIPKAVKSEHIRQNVSALDIKLTPEDMAEIDKAFPPPKAKTRLEMT